MVAQTRVVAVEVTRRVDFWIYFEGIAGITFDQLNMDVRDRYKKGFQSYHLDNWKDSATIN